MPELGPARLPICPKGVWLGSVAVPAETCSVSVVVPTRNEAANVGPLAARLAETLKDVEGGWELLFVPALVAPVLAGEAALVAGSRYVWAGGDAGLSGPWRHLVSRSCRMLVHLLVPPSRPLQDPLSGLFALQRSLLDGVALRPEGYKILLEVVVRARPERVGNVGFDFAPRHAGSSKATVRQGMLFFKHLARLVVAGRRAGPGQPVAQVPLSS